MNTNSKEAEQRLKKVFDKIALVEDFISLSFGLSNENVEAECRQLAKEADELLKLHIDTKYFYEKEIEALDAEKDQIMDALRKQTNVLLEYNIKQRQNEINERMRQQNNGLKTPNNVNKNAITKNPTVQQTPVSKNQIQEAKISTRKALMQNKMPCSKNCNTPKMTIHEYKESPLIKRTKGQQIQLNFIEFEIQMNQAQFDSIPKYMRGRETLDDMNNFLDTVIIPCFNEKYQLMHRQRNTVRNLSEMELWRLYNEQASYIAGRNFITMGDISRKLNKLLDKKILARLVMLRHVGIIQEQRVSQTVCYIWTANPM